MKKLISQAINLLFRIFLKLIALGVAALCLYFSLLDSSTKPQDRTLLLFSGLFFFVLFLGSFATNKYIELPVGIVFLLVAVQGAVTGSMPNLLRWHSGPIDISKEPDVFWYAMLIAVSGAIAMLWYSYQQYKKDNA